MHQPKWATVPRCRDVESCVRAIEQQSQEVLARLVQTRAKLAETQAKLAVATKNLSMSSKPPSLAIVKLGGASSERKSKRKRGPHLDTKKRAYGRR